ncbi:MAG: phage portal protein, partial [bacterium]|nr:phage portal protein [bacterium]
DVIHVAGFGDGIQGKDPITVARESIQGGLIYQKTGNNFFEKGNLNDRYIAIPGNIPDKNRAAFVDSFRKSYHGMTNTGTPMLLGGGAELKTVGMPPENMQFLQSKKHHVSEIARWFGVPPHKLADLERSTNNNIEHQGIEYVTDALLPWTVRIEQELNYKLFTEAEQETHYVKFNLNALMRGDLKTRAEYYSKATGGRPWMTPDEVRALE